MLNIQSLRNIVQVSAIGSINKAAEVLFISQPSLSRSIQEVESQLGIVIFKRTSKGVILTHEGGKFIERARRILREIDDLENSYSVNDTLSKDEISLAIGIERHYPAIFASMQFYNRYCRNTEKHVNLILREGNKDELVELVYGGALSLGNVHFMSDDTDAFLAEMEALSLDYIVLSECPVCAQVSISHPLAGEKSVTLEMLKPYPRVAFLDEDFTGINYASDLLQYDRNNIRKRIVLQERGTHREIITNTFGYSLGAYYNITEDTDRDIKLPSVIKCLPISDVAARFNTVLIFKKGHVFNQYESDFVNLLYDLYGDYYGTQGKHMRHIDQVRD